MAHLFRAEESLATRDYMSNGGVGGSVIHTMGNTASKSKSQVNIIFFAIISSTLHFSPIAAEINCPVSYIITM